jgi:hypothetical protein
MRGKERMDELARALANAGMTTATLDFCNARIWDGRHFQNGLDMIALATELHARRVAYVGFSAGGLAAVVAAQQDPQAVGVIALDLVDDDGLGVRMAKGLDKPLIGIMGEPSNCNAYGNGMPVIAMSGLGRYERIPGAGHCDFESPSNWLCELVCERPTGGSGGDLRERIIASTVSAAAGLMEGEARMEGRLTGGGSLP